MRKAWNSVNGVIVKKSMKPVPMCRSSLFLREREREREKIEKLKKFELSLLVKKKHETEPW